MFTYLQLYMVFCVMTSITMAAVSLSQITAHNIIVFLQNHPMRSSAGVSKSDGTIIISDKEIVFLVTFDCLFVC